MKVPFAIFLAAASAALVTMPAGATTRQHVSYKDLNLTTASGQAELQKRVDRATWKACMFRQDGTLNQADEQGACYRQTRRDVAVRVASLIADFQRGG